MSSTNCYDVLVVGGGTGGITVAARLLRARPSLSVGIVEPSEVHYYQPLWTLVGAGVFPLEASRRPEAEVIPPRATWIRDRVVRVEPEARQVHTASGDRLGYRFLVLAPGLVPLWDRVEGLREALDDPRSPVTTNYSAQTVERTWRLIQALDGGVALFTQPSTPIKCPGAAQKIMWLTDDWLRRNGRRDRTRVVFASAGGRIFGVPKYRAVLERLLQQRDIETRWHHDLVAIRGKEAVFRITGGEGEGQQVTLPFDMLHVTPPQGPPAFIADSGLGDERGWVDVDKHTLQHVRHPEIFALGDASNLPTSKTGAAVRKQAPVLVHNLLAAMDGKEPSARYDGYSSCPLTTRYGRVVLAEFDYEGRPKETFPFDQAKERRSMWWLKTKVLPVLYWKGMLRGRA